MSFFTILAILVLCIYFLPRLLAPLISRFVRWQMQRQMQRMMDNVFGADAKHQGQQGRRNAWGGRQQQQEPRRHGKIFSKSDGEYVEFEEIRTFQHDQNADGSSHTKYTEESQVTDVEWEDV